MSKSFDPYYQWLGIPPHEQPPDYYRLLGLAPFEGNPDVIESAADRQMAHVRTHQSGKYGEQSQKLLNEIAAAKLCLLSPEKKAAYNAHLKAGDNSASQEKPIKRADPIPGTPATNRRDAAPAPKQAPQASDRGGTLAPLVVVLAGGAAMLVLLLGIAGAAMWFMIDNSPAPPAVAANTGPTAPPVVEEEFDPPISPPPVKGETDSPLAETDDGVKPSPPRFPGPSGPAPVVLNPNGTPDDSTTEPVAVVNDTSEPREAADEQKQDEDEPALASFFPPENEDTRQPIPDEAERNQRRQQIEELFEVSKAVRLEEKVAIATELAKTGRETKSDLAARYALFSMAQEVASEAGDIRQALAAAKELDSQFQVDGVSLRLDSHIAAADAAVPAAQRKVIVTEGIKFVDQLFEHDRYIDAAKLIKQLQTVARKNRDADQLARLSAQQQTGSALYRAFKDASDAIERLKTDPADAESAAAAGKYVALAKGDWQLGLPMLAAGDDEALKQLAEREIAGPKTTDERRQLAKDWQESAKGSKEAQPNTNRAGPPCGMAPASAA